MRVLLLTVLVFIVGCEERSIAVSEPRVNVVSEQLGAGRIAGAGDRVSIGYEVSLPNRKTILSEKAMSFEVGSGAVIEGIDLGVRGMRPGGRRVIECPPHLHWGRGAYGSIPPNTDLTIELRMRRVE